MSIYSMTAYAREESKTVSGTATWEIRSVNQRYLETYIRVPEQFRSLEPVLRERLRKRLQRGKVECNLRFDKNEAASTEISINETLAENLIQKARFISNQAGGAMHINPFDVLRWPGVLNVEEHDLDELNQQLLAAFDNTLDDFIATRGREGDALSALIEERLVSIGEQVTLVRGRMPDVLQWQKERLLGKLEDAGVELDPGRLEQEMLLMAQKVDVAEELDRLDTHIKEANNILAKGGTIGRRLDFMMQEFNRESNTLASKSISTDITAAAVELKVLIEQMREQIQNIE